MLYTGYIGELLGCPPDPCLGSKFGEVVPFNSLKLMFFNDWFYKVYDGIRDEISQWEKKSWYLTGDINQIFIGKAIDAAFYYSPSDLTYVFIVNELL